MGEYTHGTVVVTDEDTGAMYKVDAKRSKEYYGKHRGIIYKVPYQAVWKVDYDSFVESSTHAQE